jgi:hypothetical protein
LDPYNPLLHLLKKLPSMVFLHFCPAMRYLSSLAFHQDTWLSDPGAVAASFFSGTYKLHVLDAATATIPG